MKEYVSYFASKAGVVSLSKSLGSKAIVDKENIRVDCVCPCYADTAMVTEDPVRRGRGEWSQATGVAEECLRRASPRL